jgi:hypothetical protein
MDLRCIFLVKKNIEIIYFWMLYASCNKVHNFGTYKHHGTRFINRLFVKLIFLYKPLLNVNHIQKGYQNDIIDISNGFF